MSDSYYRNLEDYEIIKDYLELDREESEPPVELPPFKPDFSSAIVVDNLPVVALEKREKLLQVLYKVFLKVCDQLRETDLHMPVDSSSNQTMGYCFIKFPDAEQAAHAMERTQGFAFTKSNIFKICSYSDLDKYAECPEEYEPVAPPPRKTRVSVVNWLTDAQCRDQFVTRNGFQTEINWANMTGEDPTLQYDGLRERADNRVWCDNKVDWSPKGTYLVTYHKAGIKLWGSEFFDPQFKFAHEQVHAAEFSPCENYLTTYSDFNREQFMIVWNVNTQEKLRVFDYKNTLDVNFQVQAKFTDQIEAPGTPRTAVDERTQKALAERIVRGKVTEIKTVKHQSVVTVLEGSSYFQFNAADVTSLQDPNKFKWSHDGNYIARLRLDAISVYVVPSMQLLDSKSIAAANCLDFAWSPASSMLSYWVPATGNQPSLINVVSIPSKENLCSRKLVDMTDGKLQWQSDGDYLSVHMIKKIKGNKKSYVLMFFRVREPGLPVDQIELSAPVLNVSWEPGGNRVCVLTGEARNPLITFYVIRELSKGVEMLFSLKDLSCNEVLWSPAGSIVALITHSPDSRTINLHDVESNVALASRRHERGNQVLWDPSGRIITSCVTTPLKTLDRISRSSPCEYIMYTFQGKVLCQVRKEHLFQFLWRPRPRDLLTPEERRQVVKKLRTYEKEFERLDRLKRQQVHLANLAARHAIAEEFYTLVNRNRTANSLLKARQVAIRDGYDSEDESNYVMEVLSSEEIVIQSNTQIVH